MSAHLTIAETALLGPIGVVVGALVSYFAVRNAAAASFRAQEKTIEANREINEQNRQADMASELREREAAVDRERRQYQRQTYQDVVSELTAMIDALQSLRNPSLPPLLGNAGFAAETQR